MSLVVGVDLGGTNFKAAVVSRDGAVMNHLTVPSAEAAGVDAWIEGACAIARDAVGSSPVDAIGLSVPGDVDPATAMLYGIGDRLDVGAGFSLRDAFADFGVAVFADNDSCAALAGERRFGAARGCDDAVMFTLGTGLGGAAVIAGEPAGNQLGHFTVEINGAPCVCGNRGCAETFASATGLRRLAREAGVAIDDVSDAFAIPGVVEQFTAALAAVTVTAIHAYQPRVVVFAGGLMGAADRFLPQVEALVKERAWTRRGRSVSLVASALGDHVGVLGAAAVALSHLEVQP